MSDRTWRGCFLTCSTSSLCVFEMFSVIFIFHLAAFNSVKQFSAADPHEVDAKSRQREPDTCAMDGFIQSDYTWLCNNHSNQCLTCRSQTTDKSLCRFFTFVSLNEPKWSSDVTTRDVKRRDQCPICLLLLSVLLLQVGVYMGRRDFVDHVDHVDPVGQFEKQQTSTVTRLLESVYSRFHHIFFCSVVRWGFSYTLKLLIRVLT